MKKNKGITLIALVITIIVLLILAGISITLVIGKNGIINRGQGAKEKYAQSETNEQKEFNELENEMNFITNKQNTTILIEEIKLDKTDLILSDLTQKEKLTIIISPSNASDKKVMWSSSDERVVVVSEDGTVTGISEGTAIITVTTSNGLKAECNVTVEKPKLFIYNKGDINSITGGLNRMYWDPQHGYTDGTSYNINSNNINLRITSFNNYIGVSTINKVDITNYRYINTVCSLKGSFDSSQAGIGVGLNTNNHYIFNGGYIYTAQERTNWGNAVEFDNKTVKCDISAYQGEYYPYVFLYHSGYATITQIYLSND